MLPGARPHRSPAQVLATAVAARVAARSRARARRPGALPAVPRRWRESLGPKWARRAALALQQPVAPAVLPTRRALRAWLQPAALVGRARRRRARRQRRQ